MKLKEYIERDLYEEMEQIKRVKKEMYEVRASVEDRLGEIIHPEYKDEFLRILATAWECNCQYANNIAEEFNISRKEFIAIERDIDLYMQIQLEEMFG